MEEHSKKFNGFDTMMMRVLDKLTGLEAWRTTTDAAMNKLLDRSNHTVTRLHHLKSVPPLGPLPQPSTAPPHHHPRWTNPFDLNVAPHQEVRPPAPSLERPSGHRVANHHRDVGGVILGSHPPHSITGKSTTLTPIQAELDFAQSHLSPRTAPLPKLDFPKFDGENPRMWKDRCEMFFEVYGGERPVEN